MGIEEDPNGQRPEVIRATTAVRRNATRAYGRRILDALRPGADVR